MTLCRIAFDRAASFPPFNNSPLPLRIAREAIWTTTTPTTNTWSLAFKVIQAPAFKFTEKRNPKLQRMSVPGLEHRGVTRTQPRQLPEDKTSSLVSILQPPDLPTIQISNTQWYCLHLTSWENDFSLASATRLGVGSNVTFKCFV